MTTTPDTAAAAAAAAAATARTRSGVWDVGAWAAVLPRAQQLRRDDRWRVAALAVLAAAMAVEVAAAAVAVALSYGDWIDGHWLVVGAVVAVVAVAVGMGSFAIARSRQGLARWCADRAGPTEAEAVRTALELAVTRSAGATVAADTTANMTADMTTVAIAAGAVGLTRVATHLRLQRRRLVASGVTALLLAVALGGGIAPGQWQRLSQLPPPPSPPLRKVGTLVGDLHLRATPPSYAAPSAAAQAQSARVDRGVDGEATLLRGSRVTLEAEPIVGVRQLRVEIALGPENQAASESVALHLSAGRVRWSRVIATDLRYRFAATAVDGAPMVERVWRRIQVRPDAAPVATLRAPLGELEVRQGEEIVIEGSVSDDFGLTRVNLAIALPSGQVRRRDVAFTEGDRRVGVREALAIDGLKLGPGEIATVWLEAADNNGLEGPRDGSSARVTLRMFSPERHHDRLLAGLAALALRWTMRLADRLEQTPKPAAKAKPHGLAGVLSRRTLMAASETGDLRRLDGLRRQLADDVLARGRTGADLEEIGRRLRARLADDERVAKAIKPRISGLAARIARGRLGRTHGRMVGGEERAVVQMAGLAAGEHRSAMVRESKALTTLEKQLSDVLQRLKKHPNDDALKAQAERLLDAIEARIARIEAAAARQAKVMPAEHLNPGADNPKQMRAELQRHRGSLDEVRKLLRQGDFGAALAALKRGRQQLAGPMGKLQAQAAAARSAEDAALERLIARMQRGIAAAQSEESGLQHDVEPSAAAQRAAAAALLRRRLQATLPLVQRLLDDARDQIRPRRLRDYVVRSSRAVARARAALSTAQEAVKKAQIDRALQALLEAREQLAVGLKTAEPKPVDTASHADTTRSADTIHSAETTRRADQRRLRTSLDRADRAATALREMLPPAESLHDRTTQRALHQQARDQAKIRRRLQQIRRLLQRRGGAHPALQRKVGDRLDHALGMMRQVANALGESDASRADTQISEVRNALAQARQLMAQQQNGAPGGQGGGRQRQAGGKSGVGPQRGPGVGRGDGRGRMKMRVGNQGDTGKDFRREVLKAMKRRAPRGYGERLRRYYRGLTKTAL